jgi:hypothetical protein
MQPSRRDACPAGAPRPAPAAATAHTARAQGAGGAEARPRRAARRSASRRAVTLPATHGRTAGQARGSRPDHASARPSGSGSSSLTSIGSGAARSAAATARPAYGVRARPHAGPRRGANKTTGPAAYAAGPEQGARRALPGVVRCQAREQRSRAGDHRWRCMRRRDLRRWRRSPRSVMNPTMALFMVAFLWSTGARVKHGLPPTPWHPAASLGPSRNVMAGRDRRAAITNPWPRACGPRGAWTSARRPSRGPRRGSSHGAP